MDPTEKIVQQNIANFCQFVPNFRAKWENLLIQAQKCSCALLNLSEQLRSAIRTNLRYQENFEDTQHGVVYSISIDMEDELAYLKNVVEQMNNLTNDLKNKLVILENSSLYIDMNDKTLSVVHGSAFQHPLQKILHTGYDFVKFFIVGLDIQKILLRNVNMKDGQYMEALRNSFNFDLKAHVVTTMMRVICYVNSENDVV